MTDNGIKREKTFSEELPYFKEQMKEVFDYYDNPNGSEDPLYIAVLRHSSRIVRKAEEEIKRQKAEYNSLLEQFRILDCECGRLEKADENQKAEIDRLKEWENLLKAEKHSLIKTEAVKEFANRLKNKIKTECNPYGKPTFDYDTSLAIMRYIDNLLKEMVGEKE